VFSQRLVGPWPTSQTGTLHLSQSQ
jgi:hypothetical protein